MKKLFSNKEVNVIEFNKSRKDIVGIKHIKGVKIKDKKTNEIYFNSDFITITDRKGNIRVLDLVNGIDITNIFKHFELVYDKKTTEKDLFIGQ